MKKIIANIADTYGIYDLHKEYSKNDQFSYKEEEVELLNSESSSFYSKPYLPQIEFKVENQDKEYKNGKVKFLSQVKNEDCNKEAIFHSNMCVSENNDVNVILIHGWRASSLNRLGDVFLDSFKERKYNIYDYILPFHMERSEDTALYSGEFFVSANVSRTLKSIQQSINDIRALIRYIKEIKKGKIVIIGLSLGGIVSNLLAEVEENIDTLISLFYANDLSYIIFETEVGKYIKKDFIDNNFSKELLNKSWSIINPSLRKPVIDKNKILLISGEYDKYVINIDTEKLWNNWDKPLRYKYKSGHSGIVLSKNNIKNDTLKFIDMWL